MVKTEDIVNSDLWRLFPAIEVSRTKEIPKDYPGPTGVPITALGKLPLTSTGGQFKIEGLISPTINGRALYKRIIIRNLKPELPETVDLAELLERCGSDYEICVEA